MKILNRKEFLNQRVGTVYQKYDPCVIESHISIKGKSFDNDWWFQPLNGVDASVTQMEDPKELDLNCQMRDGMYDEEQLFIVFSDEEVRRIIQKLKDSLEGKE